jgi:hypothetical protein
MTKKTSKKTFAIAVFIAALICISLYSSLIPNAQATESVCTQKALSTLRDVVGLDLSKYNRATASYTNNLYRDKLPRENVRCTLESTGSNIDALCTFIDGSLQMIEVFDNEGSPRMTISATKAVEMAQNFLTSYQTQSRNDFYGELNSILTQVDANKNSTLTVGNIKFQVTTSGDDVLFTWTYSFNGIQAPDKCIALRYKNGFLKYFVDNWNLYEIGSTEVNLA